MTKQRKHLQSISTGPGFAPAPIARAIRAQWRRERLLVPALIAGAMAAAPAHAATINVTADAVDQDPNNNCSIVEAFLSAETNSAVDNCTSGASDDVIVLPANSTFSFDGEDGFAHWVGRGALPDVHTTIKVTGNNSRLTVDSAELVPDFRLIGVGEDGDLTLDDLEVDGGSGAYGGNILVYDGALALIDSIVSDNAKVVVPAPFPPGFVEFPYSKYGGGIAVLGGIIDPATPTLSLLNSVVSGNGALYFGGGIFNDGGEVTLQNSEVSDNVAFKYGGGIINQSGAMTITDSRIFGNRAKYSDEGNAAGGGIANNSDGTLTLVSSTVSGNNVGPIVPGPSEPNYGGGIANYGLATLTNSTISGNSAKYGGGIANGGAGFMQLINVTVAANDASEVGGGIVNRSDMSLINSIVTGNTADEAFDNCYDEDVIIEGKSARKGHFGKGVLPKIRVTPKAVYGSGNLSADPGNCDGFTVSASINLDALADNGGPTDTHALLAGSSAIDTGFVLACDKFGITTDQRGFTRDPLCDVGSFEFGAEPVPGPSRRGVTITFNNNLILESGGENGDAGRAEVRVRVPDPLPNDVVVTLGYEGDAILGVDFTGPATLTIPMGFESVAGEIVAINDSLDEPLRERIRIVARTVVGTTGEGRRGIAAVIDDDPTLPGTVPGLSLRLPSASLALSPQAIGEAGGIATLTATLSEPAAWPVRIALDFAGLATSGSDFTAGAGMIQIPAGATSGSTTLTGIDDSVDEADETVIVNATALGAVLTSGNAVGTLVDDDAPAPGQPPVIVPEALVTIIGGAIVDRAGGIALDDVGVMAGDSNVPAAAATVTNPGTSPITVNQVFARLTANGASLADVVGARLYLDTDGDSVLDAGDPLLAHTASVGPDGVLAFNVGGLALNPGQSVRMLVTVDFAEQFALARGLMLAGTGMGLPLLGLAGWRRRKWLVPVAVLAGVGVSACTDDGASPGLPGAQERVYRLTIDDVASTGGTATLSGIASAVMTAPQ